MMQHAPLVFVPARPTRHERLFELIRQRTLSEALAARSNNRPENQADISKTDDFLAEALRSLGCVPQAA